MGSDWYNFDFLRMGHVLKCILSVMCLAIGSMAVIGGLQSAAAEDGPAKAANSRARCQALTGLHLAGVEITGARLVPATPAGTVPFNPVTQNMIPVAMPEYCRVEGVINRRKGAKGVEYGIGFALALPNNWNGRLMFQGGGAFNGSIRQPFGNACNPRDPALAQGFAVISTDSGHKGEPFDTTFMRDQKAALDFAFNAVSAVTRLGKELVMAYFGREPHHTYSVGCSTGGREGMLAAQRYPALFDGVIAGDPAMRSAYTRIAGWNATIAFNRIAPRDVQGNPLRIQAFPAEDQKFLHAAVAEQCDGLDGLKDGLILNLAACKFDPAVLQCEKEKDAGCLSAEQVTALKAAFGGPRDGQGNPLYTGFPYDLGLLGEHPESPMNILPASVPGIYNNPPSPFTFDFAPEIARIRADPVQILSDTKDWTDLGTFYRRGGKIIFYHGASDPWFSVYDTLDYFQRNKEANPEFDSSRFYSVPNMGHCGDGGMEVFDMLTPLIDWVENGKAPGAIVATDWLRTGTTRPLCPWPQYGRYKGAGDPRDAANFECRSDLPAAAIP
jgi:pimeloyl-ACP methyl ester carboxylesterase